MIDMFRDWRRVRQIRAGIVTAFAPPLYRHTIVWIIEGRSIRAHIGIWKIGREGEMETGWVFAPTKHRPTRRVVECIRQIVAERDPRYMIGPFEISAGREIPV